MKKSVLVLLLGILLLAAGCSEKSTKPEEEPPEDYTLEASHIIGAEGGTLSIEDFSLKVPAGAFSSDAELTLYVSSEDKPFGDCCVSRTFRLEGLPDECSQPLQLSIKYQGALSDSSFIAVGEEAMVASSGALDIAYELISASDSAGYLHCALPATDGASASPKAHYAHTGFGGDKGRKFVVPNSYLMQSAFTWLGGADAQQYAIYTPSGAVAGIADIVAYLNDAYTIFYKMGFTVDARYPLIPDVIVRSFESNEYCRLKYRNKDNYGCLEISADKLAPTDLPKQRIMLAREVFRTFQLTYAPSYPHTVQPAQQVYYWLNQAAVTWCEKEFVPGPNHTPADFPGNEMSPFNGMQAGIHTGEGHVITKAKNHGSGMSPFLEYLELHSPEGQSVFPSIYEQIKKGTHPVEAIADFMGPECSWYNFLDMYIRGGLYGVASDVFTRDAHLSGVFDINSDDNTQATFKRSYPDLSAKLFKINLNHKTISENAVITVEATSSDHIGDVKVAAFKKISDKLSYISHGVSTRIENVRELTDKGADIVLMVTNSAAHPPDYTQMRDIDLEVKVDEGLPFTFCKISIEVIGTFETRDWDTTTYNTVWAPSWGAEGKFEGNTFSGIMHPSVHGDNTTGTMTITVDPATLDITSLQANATSTGTQSVSMWRISGNPETRFPVKEHLEYMLEYGVSGTQACNYLGSLYYTYKIPVRIDTLLNFDCTSNSRFHIKFSL